MLATDKLFPAALDAFRAGRLADANRICQKILGDHPTDHRALRLCGLIAYQSGNPDLAVDLLKSSLVACALDAGCYLDLSYALQAAGRIDDAQVAARCACELDPRFAAAHLQLAGLLHGQGQLEKAVFAYQAALEIDPALPAAATNLANALNGLGCFKAAEQAARHALELDPGLASAANNLANALCGQGQTSAALLMYHEAARLDPADANIQYNLGLALELTESTSAAMHAYRQAVARRPDFAAARNNLGVLLQANGFVDEACDEFSRAISIDPRNATIHSNLLLASQYRSGVTPEQLAGDHALWQARHGRQRNFEEPAVRSRDPRQPLRVGFISGDLGIHPVGFFVAPVIERLPRQGLEVACYSERKDADATTARIAAAATVWRDIGGLPHATVLEAIRGDGVDVLIDLSGHTGRNRLPVLAARAAPIQATWIGYVGTTGLANMDYLICDRFHVPEEAESFYRENLLRMPHGYACFEPPPDAPAIGGVPCDRNGYVTFGCFSNPAKLNEHVLAVWAAILHAVPGSRLLLKYRGLECETSRNRVLTCLADRQIDPHRVALAGSSPRSELMACYNSVDIALDPFPYSGGLTTCEALWMGVPVVTLPGRTFAGRHACSHIANAGLPELIATDLEGYCARAVDLAQHPEQLAQFRSMARDILASSPLCNLDQFAADFSGSLWRIWHDHCQQQSLRTNLAQGAA